MGRGRPPPSRPGVQVPRSRTAVPAAPRSTPPAPAASGAPCDRISLSLFPAGGAAAAAAAAEPARPRGPRAPSPPGRSPRRCWSPGCRPRRPGGSGRKPARRPHQPHRLPRCCPSPTTCPRAPEPSAAGRRGGPGRGMRGARRTCSAPRAPGCPALGEVGAAATPRGRGGGRAGTAALKTPPRTLWVQPRRRIWRPAGRGPGRGSCAQERECGSQTRGGRCVDTGRTGAGLVPGMVLSAGDRVLFSRRRESRVPVQFQSARARLPRPGSWAGGRREGDRERNRDAVPHEGFLLSTSPPLPAPPRRSKHTFLFMPLLLPDDDKNQGNVCAISGDRHA